jgi:hypothetical protein
MENYDANALTYKITFDFQFHFEHVIKYIYHTLEKKLSSKKIYKTLTKKSYGLVMIFFQNSRVYLIITELFFS